MFDSHCHLDFPALGADLPATLATARGVGVSGWLMPGFSLAPVGGRSALLERPDVWSAVGIHPYAAPSTRAGDETGEELRSLARREGAVALGECGLDQRKRGLAFEGQEALFEVQLALARELDLPVIVHQVGAQREFQRCLARVGVPPRGGVVHAFGGDAAWAKFLVRQGFSLGVGPAILRPTAERLRTALAVVPLARLLLETDAPDQRPPGASRGVPADLILVARELCRIRELTLEELDEQIDENARILFGLDPPRRSAAVGPRPPSELD